MSETDSEKPTKKRKIVDIDPDIGDQKPPVGYPHLKRHCNNAERATDADRGDFIVKALQKLNELQQLLGHYDSENEESDHDADNDGPDEEESADEFVGHGAEALGFAVCAQETFTFLQRHGVDGGQEVVRRLRERLIGEQRSVVGGSCP